MERSFKKQVIWRNIRFWGRNTEHMFLVMVVMVAAYSIFFKIGGSSGDKQDAGLFYMIMMGTLCAYLLPANSGKGYLPLVISFGSKRREAVWGMQVMNLLFTVQYLLMIVLYKVLQNVLNGENFQNLGMLIGVYAEAAIFAIALGQFAAAAGQKFEKKGVWVSAAGTVIIISISTGTGMMTADSFMAEYFQIKERLGNLIFLGGGAAIVLYLVSLLVLFRVVKKYEVHA